MSEQHGQHHHTHRVRHAAVKSMPYVTWGNLIAFVGLLGALLTGFLPAAGGSQDNTSFQATHQNHENRITTNESVIGDTRSRLTAVETMVVQQKGVNERQDRAMEAMQLRTDNQLQQINGKVDRVLELLVEQHREKPR